MWNTALYGLNQSWLQWGTVIGVSLVATFFDLRERRIPNWLTGPVYLAGLGWATWAAGGAGLADAFLAGVLLAAPFMVLFLVGGGAGDAKLMGALGAWLGVAPYGVIALASVCLTGVVFATAWSYARGNLGRLSASLSVITWGLLTPIVGRGSYRDVSALLTPIHDEKMPYALSILVGVIVAAGISIS